MFKAGDYISANHFGGCLRVIVATNTRIWAESLDEKTKRLSWHFQDDYHLAREYELVPYLSCPELAKWRIKNENLS